MSAPCLNPVFLTGLFRSGTSLLYALLNQHPQMALMYECDVWDFPEPFSGARFRHNWLERQEFYNQALSRHRLIFGRSLSGLENTPTPEKLYRHFSDSRNAMFWGEKSPCYCVRLRQLARQYPDCSLILLWRDPIEVYRSVVHAGRTERFFARSGMLNRLIHYQEQMIQQAVELERAGIRVYHITYSDLIDKTEEVCRGLCKFLGIEFDLKMLDLSNADLSAVYRAAHHDYLRRGVIERQQFSEEAIPPAALRKLRRFRARWSRMNERWFNNGDSPTEPEPEPGVFERLYHRIAGTVLRLKDSAKRALFEFLPLPWLRTYREMQRTLRARRVESNRTSLGEELTTHWVTILTSTLVLGGVATLHFFCNPRMMFIPFYLVPCAALTLIVNRRWGTFAAIASAIIGPLLQSRAPDFAHFGVVLWNSAMRFIVLEVVVLLLDRIRRETISPSSGKS